MESPSLFKWNLQCHRLSSNPRCTRHRWVSQYNIHMCRVFSRRHRCSVMPHDWFWVASLGMTAYSKNTWHTAGREAGPESASWDDLNLTAVPDLCQWWYAGSPTTSKPAPLGSDFRHNSLKKWRKVVNQSRRPGKPQAGREMTQKGSALNTLPAWRDQDQNSLASLAQKMLFKIALCAGSITLGTLFGLWFHSGAAPKSDNITWFSLGQQFNQNTIRPPLDFTTRLNRVALKNMVTQVCVDTMALHHMHLHNVWCWWPCGINEDKYFGAKIPIPKIVNLSICRSVVVKHLRARL